MPEIDAMPRCRQASSFDTNPSHSAALENKTDGLRTILFERFGAEIVRHARENLQNSMSLTVSTYFTVVLKILKIKFN